MIVETFAKVQGKDTYLASEMFVESKGLEGVQRISEVNIFRRAK